MSTRIVSSQRRNRSYESDDLLSDNNDGDENDDEGAWNCHHCGRLNPEERKRCSGCSNGRKRARDPSTPAKKRHLKKGTPAKSAKRRRCSPQSHVAHSIDSRRLSTSTANATSPSINSSSCGKKSHGAMYQYNRDKAIPAPDIGPGWEMITVPRKKRNYVDKYWFSPVEHYQFRSQAEVARFKVVLEAAEGDEDAAWAIFGSKPRAHGSKGRSAVKAKAKPHQLPEQLPPAPQQPQPQPLPEQLPPAPQQQHQQFQQLPLPQHEQQYPQSIVATGVNAHEAICHQQPNETTAAAANVAAVPVALTSSKPTRRTNSRATNWHGASDPALEPTSRDDLIKMSSLPWTAPFADADLPHLSSPLVEGLSLEIIFQMLEDNEIHDEPTTGTIIRSLPGRFGSDNQSNRNTMRHLYRNFQGEEKLFKNKSGRRLPLSKRERDIIVYCVAEKKGVEFCHRFLPYRENANGNIERLYDAIEKLEYSKNQHHLEHVRHTVRDYIVNLENIV